jgi:putative hydrolase of the HAD superfamily
MGRPVRALLVDALGTLVRLEPPAPRLRSELSRLGLEIDAARAEHAFRAEIAFYLDHHTEGRDASSLAELRNRCAAVLHDALAVPELSLVAAREAMLAAIRFEPYPDAAPALHELRELGLRIVVASNWDVSLAEVLERTGLAPALDGVVTSAAAGARKPDARLFEAALRVARCDPGEAVHVGDSVANDVEGARAAGLRAVLVDRDGDGGGPAGVPVITELRELAAVI